MGFLAALTPGSPRSSGFCLGTRCVIENGVRRGCARPLSARSRGCIAAEADIGALEPAFQERTSAAVDCSAMDRACCGLSSHIKQGIFMRMAAGLPIALSVTILILSASGARADDRSNAIADHLGQVNSWRLIPPTLLKRCATESPERDADRRATFEAWSRANAKLIAGIERAVERSASEFSDAASYPALGNVDGINAATVQLIDENYLQDKSVTIARVCEDYGRIVSRLSGVGTIATTRGYLYTLEALLASQRSSTSAIPRPIIPVGPLQQDAPAR